MALKKLDQHATHAMRFVGEQDGTPEREFKSAIIPVLAKRVARAYLARIVYGENATTRVALCIQAESSDELVTLVEKVFRSMFGSDQSLDIMFLNEERVIELEKVCSPFVTEAP